MAEKTSGIRLTADASGLVGATDKSAEAQTRLQESLKKTTDATKSQNEESVRFVQRLKDEAETLGKTRVEVLAYHGDQLKLTQAQKDSALASLQQIQAHEQTAAAGKDAAVVAGMLTAAVIAYGAAVAVNVKSVIDEAAALNNLSQSYGISTQGLSAYKYQMSLAGVTQGEFESSMRTLANRAQEAQLGVGRGAQVFQALGISAVDARGQVKSLEQIFPELTDKVSLFRDSTNKTALVTDALGGSGAKLIPVLNQGREGFKAATEEAEQFKKIIGPEMAKQADDFNTNLTRMNALLKGQAYTIANEALPSLNNYLNKLIEASKFEGGSLGKGLFTAFLGGGGTPEEKISRLEAQKRRLQSNGEDNSYDIAAIDRSLAFERSRQGSDWSKKFSEQTERQRAAFGLDAPAIGKAGRSDFDSIQSQMVRAEAAAEARAASVDKITQAEKRLAEIDALRKAGVIKITDLQHAEIQASTERTAAIERGIIARDRDKKAAEEATKAAQKSFEDYNRESAQAAARANQEAAQQENAARKLQEHAQEIGLTTEQLGRLRIARAEDRVALDEQRVALSRMPEAIEGELAANERRLEASRRALDATRERAARGFAVEQAKNASAEWKRTSDSIERTLTDALMRGFDKGKNFAENFRDTLVAMFKTMVLELPVKLIAQAGASLVTGAMQSIGGSIFGGGGGGGGFGNILSGASTAYNAATGQGIFGALGGLFGGASMATVNASAAAVMGGASGAATAGLAGGLGAIGTALPWVGAGLFAANALGLFGGGGGPKPGEVNLVYEGGGFGFGNNNLPGDQSSNLAYLISQNAQLNDPTKFDPAILRQYVGRSVMGVDAQGGVAQMLQILAPAAQSAQADNARNMALLAQFGGQGALVGSLQGFADSMQTSQYLAPMDRLAGARSLFEDTLTAAKGGDAFAIQSLGSRASTLLSAGRDVYASGPEFAQLMKDVNREFGDVLKTSQDKQAELLAEMPVTIKQASQAQIDAITQQTATLSAKFDTLSADVRRLAAAVA